MKKESMYNELARYTDLLYNEKDYKKESDFILQKIKENHITGKLLIDVACGSGNHSKLLQNKGYNIIGVDLNEGMLNLAKKNIPHIKIYQQDMRNLSLGIKADVLICMFNSINYNIGYEQLRKTLSNFNSHLNLGGIIIFDTFFTKKGWKEGLFGIKKISTPKLDIARVFKSTSKNNVGKTEQTYIIYDDGKKKIIEDVNTIYIFDEQKIKDLMEKTGFKTRVYYDFSNNKKGYICVFVGVKK